MKALLRLGPHPLLIVKYIAHHAVRRWQQGLLRRTYAQRVANPVTGVRLRILSIDFPRSGGLPRSLARAADALRTEAELIRSHRFDLLGSGVTDLGDEIDWSRDFKSGYRWPLHFYQDLEVTRLGDTSDAKVPWELSRGHHLLTLARAATIFEDARYADEFEAQLRSWLATNPAGFGINWANSMEVALRAVNWVWAITTLEAWRGLSPALRTRVTRSLQSHGRHLARNLEGTPYLRSNHYLSNVLGLLVLGTVIEADPEAKRWLRLGRNAIRAEIHRQVHADGVGFEASLPYHGLALEIFVLAKIVADASGADWGGDYTTRLRRMLEASRVLRHPNGRLPLFGDGDSGRVLPGSFDRPATLDHLLWLGAAALGEDKPLPDDPHPEVAWTAGITAWHKLAAAPQAAPSSQTVFPEAGLYVLRGETIHVFVRCGDVGQNGNGGHGHNDLFSFELSYGSPFIVDSGTYAYTSDPFARNAFRSTAAHNTVTVASAEINPIDDCELFRLRQVARPRIELWKDLEDSVRLVARHDGYRRLHPPVIHRRSFVLERAADRLEVRDELLGVGQQNLASFIHLAPGTHVSRINETQFVVSLDGQSLQIAFSAGAPNVELSEGWVSDRFGVRHRAAVLIARLSSPLPLRLTYEIRPGKSHSRGPDLHTREVVSQ